MLSFRKIPVAKKFMDKMGAEYQEFAWKKFLSHSAENFRRGILYCCINFGYRKSLDKRGGGVSRYSVENFCLTVPKNFVGESFTLALFSGIGKVWIRGRGGSVKIFRRKIFVSQCRKTS